MQALAGVAFAALLVSAWGVGLRLLALARRTRALPEAALGAMLLCMMGLGYPLAVAGQAESALGLDVCRALQMLANALMDVGLWLPLVFTAAVFRPGARWARGVCAAGALVLAVHVVGAGASLAGIERMSDSIAAVGAWGYVPLVVGAGGFLWAAGESFRYRALLLRRDALGLGDPVVTDRIGLFAALGATTALAALSTIAFLLLEIDVLRDPLPLAVTSATGLAQALLLWLAFLPPRAYRAFVLRRAGRARAT